MLCSIQEPIQNSNDEIESQEVVINEANIENRPFAIPIRFEIVGDTTHLFTDEDFQRVNVSQLGNRR